MRTQNKFETMFSVEGKIKDGFAVRLVLGDHDLRAIAPCLDAPQTTKEVA